MGVQSLRTGTVRLTQKLKILFVCLALQLATSARGATTKELKYYALSTWKTDQGLPQNFITAIEQTPDGFLWIGTMGGLARFDGLHFTTFPGTNGNYSLQNHITALAKDRDGSLWIGSASGLNHYADGEFTQIANQAGAQRFAVNEVVADREGGVWVVTHDGLFHVDTHEFDSPFRDMRGRTPAAIAEGTDRTLWVANGTGVSALRDGKIIGNYTVADGLPAASISILYADSSGTLYAGDGHRLVRFNGKGFEPVVAPGLGNFVSLLTDFRGNLWMASGGLHGISRKSGSQTDLLTTKQGLATNDARVLFEDASHDIWIGTIAGLQRLHDGVFTTYTEDDGLPSGENQYVAVFEDRQNSIWVGSLEDGVARGRDGRFERYSVKQGLKPGQVRGFAETDQGVAVAVSDYGLFALRDGQFVSVPNLPHGYITSPVNDSAGGLWFAVNGNGVFRLRNGSLTHYTTQDGLPSMMAWSLLVDGQGGVLAGTNDGLARMRNGRFERIAEGAIISIARDREDGLWLGTSTGLEYVKDGRVTRLTQQEGLPGNQVLSVDVDSGGNVWVATSSAIARLERGQLDRVIEGKESRLSPRLFTQADGLRTRDVLPIGQVSACVAHDGRIWFATAAGLSVVEPRLESAPMAQAFIEAIAVDDVPQPTADAVVVPPGRHRLTFTYTAPDLHSPEQLRFRYRLNGWDKDWREAGAARQVSYTALPPGKYQLEIVAANEDGLWSNHLARVGLRIQPFFYQTKLFLIFALLALVSLVIEITRRRTRRAAERQKLRLQERAAERERIAYQIHDTIIQDMVGTALQLELIDMQIPEHPENAGNLLRGLTARMREMVSKSRNMVSSLQSTATPEYDLLEVLRNAASEFRLGETPELVLETEGTPREIDPLVRDEVYRICREALANAFRHSNASAIEVRVVFTDDVIEVAIQDNGSGMDEQTRIHGRPGHFGLSGMQAHANRIGATVMIQSGVAEGTRVHLTVPAVGGNWWHFLKNRIVAKRNGAIQ
jgi:ligand-binding sensor domain-containing protein/signal transduction histidine kinase